MRILSRTKIKVLAFCLLIALVLLSFTGCKDMPGRIRFDNYAPDNFPNTVWATENGEITFHVEESETLRHKGTHVNEYGDPVYEYTYISVFGTINKGEEKYDVLINFSYIEEPIMTVISEELPEIGEYGKYHEEIRNYTLVYFYVSNLDDKHFKASVSEYYMCENSIYEAGTVFDFYRQE